MGVYRIEKSSPKTSRYLRLQYDLKRLCEALSDVNPISNQGVYRLGKYKDTLHRPLLIYLLHVTIGCNFHWRKLKSLVIVKPDATAYERNTKSLVVRKVEFYSEWYRSSNNENWQ